MALTAVCEDWLTREAHTCLCGSARILSAINSEVSSGVVTDLESALLWLRSTFFYIRIQLNPA